MPLTSVIRNDIILLRAMYDLLLPAYNIPRGVDDMATKSIYKDVKIREKSLGRSLANALENAEKKKAPPVEYSRGFRRVEKNEIQDFFGKHKA